MARTTATDHAGTAAEGLRGPLIVTEDERLLDDLLRLCAAAGAEPEVVFTAAPSAASWENAPLILVDADSCPRLRGAARRGGVLLIARDREDPETLKRAVALGVDHVLSLPESESWLVERIADLADGTAGPALTVGVAGGRGGAGASTLACALAVAAAGSGRRTMLVDGDPLGGGLDILLGAERAGGLRWPDLADSRGRVDSGVLEASLPRLGSLSVLSWDRGAELGISAQAVRSVLGAARRRGGVVVVDLPRRMDDAVAEALAQIDVGLLVVPAELRAVAAASRVATAFCAVLDDLRVVARGPFGSGLDGSEIAALIGRPLAGELPPEPSLSGRTTAGAPPGTAARGPLARFSSTFLGQALAALEEVAA
ncbi:septum site-determining protein Ssd [Actinacidiphila guanduensis]|uniref:Helicase/secretion neighborhood CpaE-like protein n=1 Tax=Actinacidiphila guanduensis TaxID=310781 RepID=A0A1H0P2E9_9ACTN|nr:septum site-determining protein Ssd [Actinacidiphila guanduensis]SDO98908.1 helicase/secretion neighborhood CpaE-like protein [Actinacidiphila guanduensis]